MNKLTTLTTFFLLLGAGQIYAQTTTPAGPRDLYNTYGKGETSSTSPTVVTTGRAGARLRIELDRGGRVRWVSPKTVFQSGDKIRFHFAMNFSGYVVIINQGSSGKRSLLFPYEGVTNHVGRTADYTVPQGESWFAFDDTAGEERLTFIMSRREIQEITQLTTANSHTSTPTANTPSEPVSSNSTAPSSTPVNTSNNSHAQTTSAAAAPPTEEQEILAALNSRALDSGRDLKVVEQNNEGYVLVPDDALAKPIGFTLSLKHH